MAIACPVYAQSSDGVAIARGEAAPFGGILLSREAFDELVAEAEANDVRRSQLHAARELVDGYRERIEDLEGVANRRSWINRGCGLVVGVLAVKYARQQGRIEGLPERIP